MATAGPIDQATYDAMAAQRCPRVTKSMPWMHGDIRRPLKVAGPKRADLKVARGERALYERCSAAMLDGRLFSWSLDRTANLWLVKVTEAEDWRELLPHQVGELLDSLGAEVDVPAPVKSKRTPAPVVVSAETVAEIEEALEPVDAAAVDGLWPVAVVEYLGRLVFAAKREYAALYAAHLLDGAVLPADPGTEWASKVRTKLARLVPAPVAV